MKRNLTFEELLKEILSLCSWRVRPDIRIREIRRVVLEYLEEE